MGESSTLVSEFTATAPAKSNALLLYRKRSQFRVNDPFRNCECYRHQVSLIPEPELLILFQLICSIRSPASGGSRGLHFPRFVPQMNVRLQFLHHFLELGQVQRLRSVADRFLRRRVNFHD